MLGTDENGNGRNKKKKKKRASTVLGETPHRTIEQMRADIPHIPADNKSAQGCNK
jgi:hypothetical protein